MMPNTLTERVDKHVKSRMESLTSFYTRAILNQLENDGDFEIRDILEEEKEDEELSDFGIK